jgi:hypothetical protein
VPIRSTRLCNLVLTPSSGGLEAPVKEVLTLQRPLSNEQLLVVASGEWKDEAA